LDPLIKRKRVFAAPKTQLATTVVANGRRVALRSRCATALKITGTCGVENIYVRKILKISNLARSTPARRYGACF
jgi:hypothetical protein